jgi:hypothetical protein
VLYRLDRSEPVRRFADYLDAGALEQVSETMPVKGMVIDKDDSEFLCGL